MSLRHNLALRLCRGLAIPWALTFLVAAWFAQPAEAASTAAEEEHRLAGTNRAAVQGDLRKRRVCHTLLHRDLATGWLGLSEVGDAGRPDRSGGRSLQCRQRRTHSRGAQ